jgi:molybdopterin-guanine dinucleotide biosynthesis protein A
VRKLVGQVHKEDIVAIILAGGQARRLGDKRPSGGKAECIVSGKSLLRIVSEALVPVADSVLVVGGNSAKVSFQKSISVRHISDNRPESGPLHAVRDGLRWICRERICCMPQFVILSACDLPMINSALVLEILRHFPQDEILTKWVVPEVGSRLQYLFSVCRPTLLHSLDSYLAAGARDFQGFVYELQKIEPKSVHIIKDSIWGKIDPNGCAARDIDTPADLTIYTKPTSH